MRKFLTISAIIGFFLIAIPFYLSNQRQMATAQASASQQPAAETDGAPKPLTKAAVRQAKEQAISDRKLFAETTEKAYLLAGKDVHMSALGPNADILRMEYILVSRPDAYQLSQNGELLESLRRLGFRKMILTDGYDSTWHIAL